MIYWIHINIIIGIVTLQAMSLPSSNELQKCTFKWRLNTNFTINIHTYMYF